MVEPRSLFDDDPDEVAQAQLQPRWDAVDSYLEGALVPSDAGLDAALAASAAADVPPMQVAANQGQLLRLLAVAIGARRILEVGTLAGYSTIWLARAVPPDGEVVTLEVDERYATLAQANVDHAGVGDRVEIRVGPAATSLEALRREGGAPFDLVFVDADKQSSVTYLRHAVALARRGAVLVFDNTVRAGAVADELDPDERVRGIRRLHEAIASDPRVEATALQTVGAKGWDGFTLAVVVG